MYKALLRHLLVLFSHGSSSSMNLHHHDSISSGAAKLGLARAMASFSALASDPGHGTWRLIERGWGLLSVVTAEGMVSGSPTERASPGARVRVQQGQPPQYWQYRDWTPSPGPIDRHGDGARRAPVKVLGILVWGSPSSFGLQEATTLRPAAEGRGASSGLSRGVRSSPCPGGAH